MEGCNFLDYRNVSGGGLSMQTRNQWLRLQYKQLYDGIINAPTVETYINNQYLQYCKTVERIAKKVYLAEIVQRCSL